LTAERFATWLRDGVSGWKPAEKAEIEAEQRALSADIDIYGGYLYPAQQFVNTLIKLVDNQVFMRQFATVYQVNNAETLGAPALDNNPADPAWTTELAIGSEDSTMSFGLRELKPNPLAKYIKVSRKLLRKVPNAEALVMDRLAYKFAVVEENAFLNGLGVGQPLGVFTAGSGQGITTNRDVSTGNTTTSMTFDGLKEAKYTLLGQYWPRARWIFHRSGVKQLAKLKDGDGQYIWAESVRVGEPDRLLAFPVYMSEYAPSTFTTGLYVGILGDFSHYWIADSLQMEMQRLDELYAATNQVGFIGRLETDGMPVLENAFVRVKLA
jgi:HK97 family phage major capsid protein